MAPQHQPVPTGGSQYDRAFFLRIQGAEEWKRSHGQVCPPRIQSPVRWAKIRAGMSALDVGTGRGELPLFCAAQGAEATGIDYSEDALELAKEAAALSQVRDHCHFRAMDCLLLEFEDQSFDRVFMLDVIEHLRPDEVRRALGEIRRVLRPDGQLLIYTEPNLAFVKIMLPIYESRALNWALRPLMVAVTGSPIAFGPDRAQVHVNEQSPQTLRGALAEAGFSGRVWSSGLYGWGALEQPRQLLKRVVLTGWPLTMVPPLRQVFGVNVWAQVSPAGKP